MYNACAFALILCETCTTFIKKKRLAIEQRMKFQKIQFTYPPARLTEPTPG